MFAMPRAHCKFGVAIFLGFIVLGSLCALPGTAWAQEEEETQRNQPPAQRTLTSTFQELFDDYLFDPVGAQWVRVGVPVRSVWGGAGTDERYGWLREKGGQPRVYFTDGYSIPVGEETELVELDFLEFCQARINPPEDAAADDEDDFPDEEVFQRMRETAIGNVGVSELYLAAWLDKLGHHELALQMSDYFPKPSDEDFEQMLTQLKGDLIWSSYAGMVHAYMVREDEEALGYGEHLLELYGDQLEPNSQAEKIVAGLHRRQEEGTFGVEPGEEWPAGFAEWSDEEKLDYLIDELDEVDARQWGQPGGVSLGEDRRVIALIELGDMAVPRLIDVIESDERLTRSVHFWRDFARSRTVLSVREAATAAVMSILQVRVFEPASTGDNLTSRGDEAAAELATKLREYWETYGKLPFDERMMAILTSEETTFEAKREAAGNLGRGAQVRYSTTVFSNVQGPAGEEEGPNPTIEKFSDPTGAEAILAAMLADLAEPREAPGDASYQAYVEDRIRMTYLASLAGLGDTRITPRLVELFNAETRAQPRRRLAMLSEYLEEPGPWQELAAQFQDGALPLAELEPRQAAEELRDTIGDLTRIGGEVSEEALWSVTSTEHPYYEQVAEHVLEARGGWHDEEAQWLGHPYCFAFLRDYLDDETPTGTTYEIRGDTLSARYPNGSSSGSIPLALREEHLDQAEERRCDKAALQISNLVFGMPAYHPLMVDAPERLDRITELLAQYGRNYRQLNRQETSALSLPPWDVSYAPALGLLDHPATAQDFASGLALFHLEGRGELAHESLPAIAILPSDLPGDEEDVLRGLIVQAERDSETGAVTYGILFADGPQVLSEEELTEVLPLVSDPVD